MGSQFEAMLFLGGAVAVIMLPGKLKLIPLAAVAYGVYRMRNNNPETFHQ